MSEIEELMASLYDGVLDYESDLVHSLVKEALGMDVDAQEILDRSLIPAMDEIGSRFSEGEIFVPEMLMAANAMKRGLELLRPILAKNERKPIGHIVIGTVKGDLHDIGKNLVSMSLEGAGFEVIDLGVDVNASQFIDAVGLHKPQIVALSALLTTTMISMRGIIESLKSEFPDVKVIVGGAPLNETFARSIHADGFGQDGYHAAIVARQLVGQAAAVGQAITN